MATAKQIPGALDITIVQGDDLNLQFSVDENLSGYSAVTTIHHLHGSSESITTVISSGTALSYVQFDISASVSSAFDVTTNEGAHNWKTVLYDTSGLTRTWIKGAFTVLTKI